VNDDDRVRWARALTSAGWLFVFAYLAFVTSTVRRAAQIRSSSFDDGVWGQRIETVSFVAIPQNLIVLAPAAVAAVAASLVAASIVDRTEIWLAQLVRVVAGVSYVIVAVATIGIVAVFFRNPDAAGDLESVLSRLGGVLMSLAMIRVCLEAERSA
jgi:ABC-type sugar transport system permease subunit